MKTCFQRRPSAAKAKPSFVKERFFSSPIELHSLIVEIFGKTLFHDLFELEKRQRYFIIETWENSPKLKEENQSKKYYCEKYQ